MVNEYLRFKREGDCMARCLVHQKMCVWLSTYDSKSRGFYVDMAMPVDITGTYTYSSFLHG